MTELEAAGEQQVPQATQDEWANGNGQALPRSCDVVIVGGGIVGVSAAYHLARRGVSVVLCEKGRIAGEQSGRNWGWVRQQGRDARELPLMIYSMQIWRGLAAELGEDLGFTQGGCLYLAESPGELAHFERWLSIAARHQLDTRLLNPAQLGAVLNAPQPGWLGALYTASDGRAEPNRVSPALARGAARAGAHIRTHCAVRGIERSAGRVHAVVTEHGVLRTAALVCAAGAWTNLLCGSFGIDVPQLTVKGTVARLAPTRRILEGEAYSNRVAIRRRADGGYTVAHGSLLVHSLVPASLRYARKFWPSLKQERSSLRLRVGKEFLTALRQSRRWDLSQPSPFERERILNPAPDAAVLDEIRAGLRASFPEISEAPFAETWAGMIESSPDVLPIISAVETVPGLYVATGFSGHGFGIGPGAGAVIADLVRGATPAVALDALRLSRFFDGSVIRPGPSI
ncbi:MAG TPA: FAD-binding oxidoreductase [Steroidobacteraceae bacterium]|nr:FAD-binding oxidoreductase [Steroidobacteraceae bacterium]